MSNIESGRRARLLRPLDLKNTKIFQRQSFITPAGKLSTQSCGYVRATVRNVTALNGPAACVCRACFAHLRASEVRAVLVARWNSLFNVCASIPFGWRRVAAILAPIGVEGRATV